MPKRNRKTLKESFRQGRKPSQQDFENLIDSSINILDDGLSKSADTGIGLAPLQGNETIMSIYREPGDEKASWAIAVDAQTGNLKIGKQTDEGVTPMLTFRTDGHIELGEATGQTHLSNLLNIPGRKGSFLQGQVPANGKWHDISPELEGSWVLEIVAGCGRRHTGKHALIMATAMHCFGKKARIHKTESHYGSFGNKLCLRWVKNQYKCKLQIRTRFDYGDDIQINYHISRLWDAPYNEDVHK